MMNYPVLQVLACRSAIITFSRYKILFLIFACLSGQQVFSQWTTSGTNIYNSNTGNVGIGTTNPLNTLHVSGTAYIQSPSATTGLLINVNSPNVYNQGGAFSFNTNGNTYNSLSNSASTAVNHELRFIRTNGTSYDLSAFGINYVAAEIALNTAGGLRWRTNGHVSSAFSEVEPSFYTWSAGTYHDDVLRLFSNGNIGIGVGSLNSGYKLDVNGSVRVQSFILPTAAAAGKVLTSDASGNATWQTGGGSTAGWGLTGNTAVNPTTSFMGTTDNSVMTFRTNNIERIRIDGTSGNVSIGTANAQGYTLAVNGSAIFTQAVVKLYPNWPDYVFNKEYQLPSLDSLAKYIASHRHLPEIPSADSIAAKGIDLGGNQALLLKKIEELTLYAIQQQQQLDELKIKNEKMEAMLNKLNASINK